MRTLAFASVLCLACHAGQSSSSGLSVGGATEPHRPPAATTEVETTGAEATTSGTTGAATTEAAMSSTSSSSSSATTAAVKFDLGAQPDLGMPVGCQGGDLEFSFIWIANSPEGTVSKIDTKSRTEVGRYRTGPEPGPDPSRTSVNLRGDVAVVNRAGSITKIVARAADCVDHDGSGTIETSSGASEVLPWGQDECVVWNTPLRFASRPAAWTSGTPVIDGDGCMTHVEPEVWTSAPDALGNATVYLLRGADGTIVASTTLPGVDGGFGVYGGAVDSNNDFWGAAWSTGPLVHVRHDDLSHEVIAVPDPKQSFFTVYGFTVDHAGRAWVGGQGSLQRYDPSTASWTSVALPPEYTSLSRGMQEDANGQLWVAALSQGILRVDTDSASFVELIDAATLVNLKYPAGISVDVDGQVWMVDTDANGAHVLDPETHTAEFVGGLVGPYTYSDMTGWALKNVVGTPEG
ncbi:hypothetical protein OV203_07335 [Nannocystis sp. ILAH1]|uniref:Vgb family protein n=1 Tax=unclassified Nannocystis TaxID=2627009 RepID=UPI00226E93AA|nr:MULTISPECIES: hypothetical protein [unclassified Nannocystis]MCY0986928.1 hypothetical protein [Nannocystis sp. ILAH1]MCY1071812.1 hypothetical protein [Nannocystis sp. RBIL2]